MLTFNVIVSTGWPIGELILALEAYLLRDHVILQLVSHAPMFFVIVVIFIGIPESTRWLISKKMYDQASKQVYKIAKINGTTAPKDMCDPNNVTKNVALEGCIDTGKEIFGNPIYLIHTTCFIFFSIQFFHFNSCILKFQTLQLRNRRARVQHLLTYFGLIQCFSGL